MPVAWFQLAGEAGQGKSRLAFDLAFKAKDDMGWNAGFVVDDTINLFFKKHIETWLPDKPTLSIFDYIIGRTEDVKLILRTLSQRREEFKDNHVRILLLERQAWSGERSIKSKRNPEESSGSLALSLGEDYAHWYKQLCDQNVSNQKDRVLENIRFNEGIYQGVDVLGELDRDSIIKIVHEIAEKESVESGIETALTLSDDEIFETLKQIDEAKRPLYAYLLGVQLAHDPEGYKSWTHIDILNKAIKREEECRWVASFEREFPAYRDEDLTIKIAVLATIVRELDYDSDVIQEHFGKLNSTTIKEAFVITSGTLIKENDDLPQSINALEPDLLGEWFVLNAFDKGLDFKSLIDIAWQYFENKITEFLDRITRDFFILPDKQCKHPDLTEKILTYIEKQPNTEALYATYMQRVQQYSEKNISIPAHLINTLSNVAENKGDASIMFNLGNLYITASSLKDDIKMGIYWLEQAAEAGNSSAMHNLGFCYAMGHGVEKDWGKAISYFKQAAEAGDSTAMYNLGFCYEKGHGVEKDWEKAIAYYEQAIEAGYENASAALLRCRTLRDFLYPEDTLADNDLELISIDNDCEQPFIEFDLPLVGGNWKDLSLSQLIKILPQINGQLKYYTNEFLSKETVALRGRQIPLKFYPNKYLLEIQVCQNDKNRLHIISALLGEKSALLLDGTSDLIHGINPDMLSLSTDIILDYLSLFCVYVRAEGRPFQIIASKDDIPFNFEADKKLIASINEKVHEPKLIDDTLIKVGHQRVEACLLYGNDLFSIVFEVHRDGMVKMVSEEPIASDLPIHQRQYQGIFRTLLET